MAKTEAQLEAQIKKEEKSLKQQEEYCSICFPILI